MIGGVSMAGVRRTCIKRRLCGNIVAHRINMKHAIPSFLALLLFTPTAIAAGYLRVQALMRDMAEGRQSRLEKLGFARDAAQQLSALHTRNFM